MILPLSLSLMMLTLSMAPQNKGPSVTIAMAQVYCISGDREGNLVRIENAISDAKAGGAEIVVFPETMLFGWVNPVAHERAYPIPGKDSDLLSEMARKHDLFVCIGLSEKEGNQLYDTAVLIDSDGQILLKHRKRNILTELMSPPYSQGKTVKVANTPWGKVGLLICADSFDQQILDEMSELSPDLMLIPYGWAAPEDAWPEHGKELVKTVRRAAKELGCPVIGPNSVGMITSGPWRDI